ncbi:hypothetical protein HAX54_032807 [Datura stramonium]|uniref:Uncharacterized protein n=1 Tax=Datura stramonium TaxID=4076 RepID=A0ABS8VDJ6_DATST|nr:hypothetical protein [Datura stramonium]
MLWRKAFLNSVNQVMENEAGLVRYFRPRIELECDGLVKSLTHSTPTQILDLLSRWTMPTALNRSSILLGSLRRVIGNHDISEPFEFDMIDHIVIFFLEQPNYAEAMLRIWILSSRPNMYLKGKCTIICHSIAFD